MVAHPDDCVIFGYSFMQAWPEIEWTVCYLTYTAQDPRGREFEQFWHRRGVGTVFLGFVDDYRDIAAQRISFNETAARRAIDRVISDRDLVLTHDPQGDYGHLHHVLVASACQHHPARVEFAAPGTGTYRYELPANSYTAQELPQHWEVIQGFHSTRHANDYTVTEAALAILETL
jgi:hypothetical protein